MEMLKVVMAIVVALSGCSCQKNWPPRMISIFQDQFIPEANKDPLTVQCRAQNGDISFTWKKDGKEVQNSQQVNVDKTSGEITFRNVEMMDFGTYQCFATNQYGTALSNPFKLMRAVLLTFGSPGQVVKKVCEAYTLCSIQCRDKPKCAPQQDCRVEWKIGEGTEQNVVIGKRIAVDKDGTLHFLWLDPNLDVREKDGKVKQYGCGMWNEKIKTLNKGSLTDIEVPNTDTTPNKLPATGITYSDDKVVKGRSATLICIFHGYPVPDIEWKDNQLHDIKDGGRYSIQDFGRRLVIRNVSETDEGNYHCYAENPSARSNMKPFLNVTSKPFLNIATKPQMQSQVISAGKNAVFSCDAISLQNPPEIPPTPPKWFRNGEPLNLGDVNVGPGKKFQISEDRKVLTVVNVTKDGDPASFQCTSSNSEGTMFADALLSVIDPITILYPPEGTAKETEINIGDEIVLGVVATTDPSETLIYEWEYIPESNDPDVPSQPVKVGSSSYWTLFNGNKNLSINTKEFGDDKGRIFDVVGTYRVTVKHNYDFKRIELRVYTQIVVTKAPIVPGPATAEPNLWFLAIIFGVIVLIIVIILIVCMLFRNRGGTYFVDKKEVAAGHDPEKELKDSGFHDLSRGDDDDNPKLDKVSLSDDFEKDMGSDDDSMADYDGDLNASKFNEDGSFIGLYGDKKSKTAGSTTV